MAGPAAAGEPEQSQVVRADGSFMIERIGIRPSLSRDLYHFLLTCSWKVFLFVISAVYLLANALFALLYSLEPGGIVHASGFAEHFFFAVQTMSTVGYGSMSPDSTYTHLVMVLQSVFGFVLTAISTGLVFSKFSRVKARVLFSRDALIHIHDGKPVLTFRCANERSSQILDATVKLNLAFDDYSLEGLRHRRFIQLSLQRDSSPLFALVWNVYHVIDEASPLWGMTAADLERNRTSLLITFNGLDDALIQAMHTRYAYNYTDIRFDRRFHDILSIEPDGRRFIDYRHFHDTLSLDPAHRVPWAMAPASEALAQQQKAHQHRAGIEDDAPEVGQQGLQL